MLRLRGSSALRMEFRLLGKRSRSPKAIRLYVSSEREAGLYSDSGITERRIGKKLTPKKLNCRQSSKLEWRLLIQPPGNSRHD